MNSLVTDNADWMPFSKNLDKNMQYAYQEYLKNKFPVEYPAKFLETGPDIKAGYPVGPNRDVFLISPKFC